MEEEISFNLQSKVSPSRRWGTGLVVGPREISVMESNDIWIRGSVDLNWSLVARFRVSKFIKEFGLPKICQRDFHKWK